MKGFIVGSWWVCLTIYFGIKHLLRQDSAVPSCPEPNIRTTAELNASNSDQSRSDS
jgi:hypothetical protein